MERRRESRLGVSFQAELIEALGAPGCGFCRLGQRTVTRFLDILGYEDVNDVPIRGEIREALGLCNRHAWRFLDESGNILGVAIIARDLLRTLQKRTAGTEGSGAGRMDGDNLRARGRCVACRDLAAITRDSADALIKGWIDPSLRGSFAASSGLCWTHLVGTLGEARSGERRAALIADQRSAWARLHDDAGLLREALSSTPRIWGTEIADLPGDLTPIEPAAPSVAPEGRCPICASIRSWLDEEAAPTAEDLPVNRLLCAVHAWQPRGRSFQPLDTLRALQDDLDERLATLAATAPADLPILRWTRRWLGPAPLPSELTADLRCPLCAEQLRRELGLAESVPVAVLCVPHLRLAATRHPAYPEIRALTRAAWHAQELHLAEFIRKHDYRFHQEPLTPDEAATPVRATELIVGAPGIR